MVTNTLVPEGLRLYSGSSFALWHDGAPAHRAASTARHLNKFQSKMQVMTSPPASPDINIAENCWELSEDALMGRKFSSFQAYQSAVREAWRNIPIDTIRKLFKSMPQRVAKLIAAKGAHIERNVYS